MFSIKKILCLFLLTNVCFSQVIKGKIVDSETNLPVISASIYVSGSSYGTISNENGIFELDTKGIMQPIIMISTINYNLATIENTRDNVLYTIKLHPKVEQLK